MKNLKRTLTALLAAALVFSLPACGGTPSGAGFTLEQTASPAQRSSR